MKKEFVGIAPVNYLEIEQTVVLSRHLLDSNVREISKLSIAAGFHRRFGNVFMEQLLTNNLFFVYHRNYSEYYSDSLQNYISEEDKKFSLKLCKLNHFDIESILFCFWLVKDNSVFVPEYYLIIHPEIDHIRNLKMNLISNSKGEFETTTFQKKELDEVMELRQCIDNLMVNSKIDANKMTKDSEMQFQKTQTKHNRFEKAVKFINEARSTNFIPSKISNYIGALESLLSTTKEQISNTLSERVALLLETDFNRRIEMRSKIKAVYNLRSVYIHGSNYSEKEVQKLIDLSQYIDDVMRRLIVLAIKDNKVRDIIDKSDKQLETWFMENYIFKNN